MSNLNEKYFTISERRGRNHQNKFCLRPLKGRFSPWELNRTADQQKLGIKLKYRGMNCAHWP